MNGKSARFPSGIRAYRSKRAVCCRFVRGIFKEQTAHGESLEDMFQDAVSITAISTILKRVPFQHSFLNHKIVIETAVKKTVRRTVFRHGVSVSAEAHRAITAIFTID